MFCVIVCVLVGNQRKFEFLVTMLNAFKREVPHLIPILLRDGGKMCFYDKVEEQLHLSRLENEMVKLSCTKLKN